MFEGAVKELYVPFPLQQRCGVVVAVRRLSQAAIEGQLHSRGIIMTTRNIMSTKVGPKQGANSFMSQVGKGLKHRCAQCK